ncbi:MAG: PepSY domain-containing protein [Nitrospinae bacterium]|nr:PepSY domain-containing protein [Nitrospinota bacterium]
MNFNLFKKARATHKVTGFVCALFFLILSISGIMLMHRDTLGLNTMEVSGKFLPDKYFKVVSAEPEVQSIAVSHGPSPTIYVGARQGLFKSADGGKSWKQLRQGLFDEDIRSLAIDPSDPLIVYAGTAKGIFKSEDGGENWPDWMEGSSGLNHTEIIDLAINPKNPEIIFAATTGGLYRSEDAGDTWELNLQRTRTRFVRISPNAKNIYLGTDKAIFKSADGGDSWERKWEETLPESFDLLSLDTDPEFLYAGTRKGLYKSFNRGLVWIKDKGIKSENILHLAVSPDDHSAIYLATEKNLYYTNDGGDHWQPLKWENEASESGARLKGLTLVPRKAKTSQRPMILAGTTAGIFISLDGTGNWFHPKLVESATSNAPENLKMDMVKLITEIHTGRFFGSWFMLLVDLATLGLIFLMITGIIIALYRTKVAKTKKFKDELDKEELAVDRMLDIQETADDLSHESHEIHDMIEHINEHLSKCKSIYLRKEKKEIEKISEHIVTIDKKMHHLMERIEEFEKLSQE